MYRSPVPAGWLFVIVAWRPRVPDAFSLFLFPSLYPCPLLFALSSSLPIFLFFSLSLSLSLFSLSLFRFGVDDSVLWLSCLSFCPIFVLCCSCPFVLSVLLSPFVLCCSCLFCLVLFAFDC